MSIVKELREHIINASTENFNNFKKDWKERGYKSPKAIVKGSYELEANGQGEQMQWDAGYISGLKCASKIAERLMLTAYQMKWFKQQMEDEMKHAEEIGSKEHEKEMADLCDKLL